jgi:O-antigen/teichoic acid export membrane protein
MRSPDSTLIRSSGWVAIGYGGSHVLGLAALLVLARLLDPSDFGVAALALSLLSPLLLVHSGGMGQALVHRTDLDEPTRASAFLVSLLSSLALFAAAFVLAPLAADLFRTPELAGVLRVMALTLPLRALAMLPGTALERQIDFRGRAGAELTGATARVAVSVVLAAAGYGVWALALGQVGAAAAQTLASWILVPRRPRLRLANRAAARGLLRYGLPVSGANVASVVSGIADNLIVGRILGAGALGVYAVAFRLASVPAVVVSQVLRTAMFTVLCRVRDDLRAARETYLANVGRIALLSAPVAVVLIVAAEPIVRTLLGERWLAAVTPLRILAGWGLVKAITATSGEVLKAFGKTGLTLSLATLEAALLVPLVIVGTLWLELPGAALGMLAAAVLAGVPALGAALLTLRAGWRDLAAALAPAAVPTTLLAGTLALAEPAPLWALLAAGTLVYTAAALVFARRVVRPVWAEVRRRPA